MESLEQNSLIWLCVKCLAFSFLATQNFKVVWPLFHQPSDSFLIRVQFRRVAVLVWVPVRCCDCQRKVTPVSTPCPPLVSTDGDRDCFLVTALCSIEHRLLSGCFDMRELPPTGALRGHALCRLCPALLSSARVGGVQALAQRRCVTEVR